MNMTWHRWPIILFSIPFAAVLFGIVMITSALYFPDDMVVDEYYKDGMAINQRIHSEQLAKTLGITARLTLDASGILLVALPGATDSVVQLSLYHVTDERLDRQGKLLPYGPREYVGGDDISAMLAEVMASEGIWYVELIGLDAGWRLRDRIVTPVTTIEVLPRE